MFVASFCLSFFITRYLSDHSASFGVLDVPNERSLHTRPTPRTGGIAITLALFITATASFWPDISSWPALAAGISFFAIALISYADDRYGLRVRTRLFVHSAAATLFAATWLEISPQGDFQLIGLVAAVLFLVWMTNLYNFMDGMDGFAGGMGVIGFGALAAMGWTQSQETFFALGLLTTAACAGFLAFNFPPARIFMGDVGSTVLGFLAGAFMVWGVAMDILTPPTALLVFSVFIVDASVTLVRRFLRRENIARAHRSHYYQRAVQLGFSHRQVVLVEYGLMFGSAATAIAMSGRPLPAQWSALAVWGLIYIVAMWLITRMERTRACE